MSNKDYTDASIRAKGFQRAHVIQVLFGGQQALGGLLGVTRGAVNHAIYSRSPSARIEEYVLARIPQDRADLRRMWERPWAKPKTDRARRDILKIAAVLGAMGFFRG